MVEGPGCTRNGNKASALVGHTVTGTAGRQAGNVSQAIRVRTLFEVLTLGKQLWLFFKDGASSQVGLHSDWI